MKWALASATAGVLAEKIKFLGVPMWLIVLCIPADNPLLLRYLGHQPRSLFRE